MSASEEKGLNNSDKSLKGNCKNLHVPITVTNFRSVKNRVKTIAYFVQMCVVTGPYPEISLLD